MDLLRVLTRPNLGGPTVQALALQEPLARLGVRTLLAIGEVGAEEEHLHPEAHGLERVTFERAVEDPSSTGFCVVPGLGRGLSPGRDLRALKALRTLIRARRPQVVHTHTSKAGALGRLACPRGMDSPALVHTFHGLVLRDYAGRFVSSLALRIERFLARRTDLCLTVSASCGAELRELGVHRDAEVVWPAVPRVVGVSPREPRDSLRPPRLVFVGRLAPVKRVRLFVDLLEHPDLRALDARGVVIGDGPEREALTPARSWIEHQSRSDRVFEELRRSDLLVLPSKREGMPLVGIEAALVGVPTLGFDVPGVGDLVVSSGIGRVIPAGEGVQGLARAAVHLLTPGREFVADPAFVAATDPERVAERLSAAYRRITER